MQLNPSFAALLAGVLLAFSENAVAAPTNSQSGLITLPLKRVEQRSDGVHPHIYLQQHINRGLRRLGRMTGREVSNHELRANIERRAAFVGDEALSKRYNRAGVSKQSTRDVHSFKKKGAAKAAKAAAAQAAGAKAAGAKAAGAQAAGAQAAGAGAQAAGAQAAGAQAAGAQAAGAQAAGAAGAAAAGTPIVAGAPQVAANTVTKSGTPTADNSLALDIEANDVGYLATVQLGTPPRDFLLLMDSGSSDLWVGSETCQSEAGGDCGNHNFLGSKTSSSFVASTTPFAITYGTGNVQGFVVTDNLQIGNLQLAAHPFGVTTMESVDFSSNDTPFDGLMGLAQSALSEEKVLTPPESLAQNKLVQQAIVSYKIPRLADNLQDGEITFGGLDPTKFNQQTLVNFANVNPQGFWEGNMDAITVDGQDTGLQGRTAILDTGTTLIIAPPQDAAAVHALIQGAGSDGQGGFTVPCDTTASVALSFGGQAFKIDPRDLAFQQLDNNNTCASGISPGMVGGATEWLVGDVFLKNAYFSTNVNDNSISLATLA